ncbi:Uncharacterised protein [Mycobacterium tuberculosis]|nr:Uncharacterised protein [Mycobacterium tuberculosis]
MSTRTRSRVRSISTSAIPARSRPLDSSRRIATSSLTYSAYCLSAYQRDFQSVVMPSRKPCGLIFWPTSLSLPSLQKSQNPWRAPSWRALSLRVSS